MALNQVIGLDFKFDADNLIRGVQESKSYLNALRKEQVANTSAFGNWKDSIKGVEKYLEYQNKTLKVNADRVKALTDALEKTKAKTNASAAEIQRISNYLNDAQIEYNKTSNNIKLYTERLAELKAEAEKAGDAQSTMVDNLSRGTQIMTTAVGNLAATLGSKILSTAVNTITSGISASINASIGYEQSFAKVKKTVSATQEELAKLSDEIKSMSNSIPHTAESLAEIAALGGQLGVSTSGLAEFTRTMALLGDATDLTAENAGELIAQFANVTNTSEADFGRIGSVLVELGNNTATTESKILEMSQRLAAAGTAAGLSADQIIGMSAALSSMGIEAESGATSLSKMINRFQVAVSTGDGLQEIAKVVGVTADEFSRMFRDDAGRTFEAFVRGLANVDDQVAVLQKDLGITEVRLTNALQALAGNADLLGTALDLSSEAWKNNTALAKEASTFYGTTASKIEQAKSSLTTLATRLGDLVAPAITLAADALVGLLAPLETNKKAIDIATQNLLTYAEAAKTASSNISETASSQTQLNNALIASSLKELDKTYTDAFKKFSKYRGEALRVEETLKTIETGIYETARQHGKTVNSIEELNALMRETPDAGKWGTIDKWISIYDPTIEGPIEDRIELYNEYAAEYVLATENMTKWSENMRSSVLGVAQAVKDGGVSLEYVALLTGKDFAEAVRQSWAQLEIAATKEKQLEEIRKRSTEATEKEVKALEGSGEPLEKQLERYYNLRNAIGVVLQTADKSSTTYAEYSAALDVYNRAIETTTAKLDAVNKLNEDAKTQLQALSDTTEAATGNTDDRVAALDREIESLTKEKDSYASTSAAGAKYAETLSTIISKLSEQRQKLVDEMKEAEYNDSLVKAMSAYSSAISSYGTEAEKTAQKVKNVNNQIEQLNALSDYADAALKSKEITQSQFDAIDSIIKKTITLLERARDAITDPTSVESVNKITEGVALLSDYIKDLDNISSSTWTKIAVSAADAAKTIVDAFEDAESTLPDKLVAGLTATERITDGILSSIADKFKSDLDGIKDKSDELEKMVAEGKSKADKAKSDQMALTERQYREGALTYDEYLTEKQKADERYEKTLAKLEADRQKESEELAKKQNEIAEKAFKAEKANKITSVTIDAASAIVKAYSELGVLGGSIAAGVLAALATAQIATIAGTKYVPKYAKGGVFDSPHIGIIGEAGTEAVMPLENNTEWIDVLARKLNAAQNTYNRTSNDSHDVTVNQQIYARPQSRREIYLQTRAALNAGRR